MKRSHLISIGAMVIVALALVIRGLLFLHPQPGDGGTKIHVRFQNIDKISKGSKVTFAGKPVGEVENILIIQNAFDERPKDAETVYPYELVLSIDSSVRVYETDVITAKTSGLLGERFIAIIPQPARGQPLVPVSPGEVLYAYEPPSVEDTFKDISTITKKADSAFGSILNLIENNQNPIQQTTQALEDAAKGLKNIIHTAQESSLVSECASLAVEAKTFIHNINHGNGTISQLINNPRLYNDASRCLQKTDFFIDSLSSYGLFFHTNPSWQRNRVMQEQKEQENKKSGIRNTEEILNEIDRLIEGYHKQIERSEKTQQDDLFFTELAHKINELKKIEAQQ